MSVTGQPFSAIRYHRVLRHDAGGQTTTVADQPQMMVARDTDGRIFITTSDAQTNAPCDLPGTNGVPICNQWSITIFDPIAATLWHWGIGEIDYKRNLVEWSLDSSQLVECQNILTPPSPPNPHEAGSGNSVEDLGEQIIQGLLAHGFRTVTSHQTETSKPDVTIHEVWISNKFGLVMKAVDGDPSGEETISGLENVTLTPAVDLFKLPEGRVLFQHDDPTFKGYRDYLAYWLVH
jgi:hypothetical protein